MVQILDEMDKKNITYSFDEITALMRAFQKSQQTIKSWIKNDHPILTSDIAKQALKNSKK